MPDPQWIIAIVTTLAALLTLPAWLIWLGVKHVVSWSSELSRSLNSLSVDVRRLADRWDNHDQRHATIDAEISEHSNAIHSHETRLTVLENKNQNTRRPS